MEWKKTVISLQGNYVKYRASLQGNYVKYRTSRIVQEQLEIKDAPGNYPFIHSLTYLRIMLRPSQIIEYYCIKIEAERSNPAFFILDASEQSVSTTHVLLKVHLGAEHPTSNKPGN